MKFISSTHAVLAALVTLGATASASNSVLFDFNNAPDHTSLPITLTQSGITAHFSATGQGFSIQDTSAPVVPQGFTGRFIYPNSIYQADLLVSFDQTLTDFSILYAPQELACDDSCTMRVTATMDGVFVGTNTKTTNHPGTWPVDTLSCSFAQGFNGVVVHYDKKPPTCTDYGVIFLCDDMRVTPLGLPPAPTVNSVTPNHGNQAVSEPVTIAGTNFTGATSVRFGGIPISSFVVNSASSISANLPATALTGWVDVSVTTAGGTGTLSSGYDYFAPPIEVGVACSTPTMSWSGAPCLGQNYAVTTAGLGAARQLLLVDWSNKSPLRSIAFSVPSTCSSSGCAIYLHVDQAVNLGATPGYTFAIPNDPSLAGAQLTTQALIRGCPNITTQALNATIGL